MSAMATSYVTSRNGCNPCAPLGAFLAIHGIEGAICVLHGSHGCAAYIRRCLIGHFREPVEIPSFGIYESAMAMGGEERFSQELSHVCRAFHPQTIGVVTTCISEIMGEHVGYYLSKPRHLDGFVNGVHLFHVATPSHCGTYTEGFWETILSLVTTFAKRGPKRDHISLLPGILSPADYRYLRELLHGFGIDGHIIPDCSDTLDGPIWSQYRPMPDGGTPFTHIEQMGGAQLTIEFSALLSKGKSPAQYLTSHFGVANAVMPLPIGIRATDRFVRRLITLARRERPSCLVAERLRLLRIYSEGHKYVSGAKAIVFGEPDLVVGLAGFLAESGIHPVLCAALSRTGRLKGGLRRTIDDERLFPHVIADNLDFEFIEETARQLKPDLIIGNSYGHGISRRLGIPLIRVGFPIHDRLGGQRILHVGYRGAAELYERIVNALIDVKRENGDVRFTDI